MSKSAYLCAGTAFAIFLVPYVQPVTAGAGWWLLAYLLAALGSLLPDIEFLNPLHRRRLEDPMFHMRDVYFGLVTAAIVVKVTEWVLTIYWRPIRLRLIIQIIAVVLFVQLCKYAKKEYRNTFGHSFIGLLAFSTPIFMIFPHYFLYFSAAYFSHIMLSMLECEGVKIFYPNKKKVALGLVRYGGVLAKILGVLFAIALFAAIFIRIAAGA